MHTEGYLILNNNSFTVQKKKICVQSLSTLLYYFQLPIMSIPSLPFPLQCRLFALLTWHLHFHVLFWVCRIKI